MLRLPFGLLLNGGPVSLTTGAARGTPRFIENPAVLDMFWAGEEGGNAIADVLFGNYNPGGKLPDRVYNGTREIPPMTEYDITKGFTICTSMERRASRSAMA